MLFVDNFGNSLDFDVVGYEFEENKSAKDEDTKDFDWDANWLTIKIIYDKGGFKQECSSSCVLTMELKDFVLDLEKLNNGEIDSCELNAFEPYLKMSAKKDKGCVEFHIEYIFGRSRQEKLAFTSNLSNTEFDYILKEMKELSAKYKVR